MVRSTAQDVASAASRARAVDPRRSVAGTGRPGYTARCEVLRHVRHALDRCGGRRPDGPRADACHFGNAGRGRSPARWKRRAPNSWARMPACWRACPPTASSCRPICGRCRRTPTAFSISPCRARPSPMSRSPPQRGLVHVIGTTGLSASDDAVIKSVTSRAIVVKSGNMSLGVNLLAALVKRVAQSLDDDFDIEILEMHHKAKIDAPSGTALDARRSRGRGPQDRARPAFGARPRRPSPARARPAISALPRCAAAPSPATTA